MVVSVHALASRAGVEIMHSGGNAVDAAVATGFALAVVHSPAGNIGGGGFMLIRMADGKTHFLDYREKAPAAATARHVSGCSRQRHRGRQRVWVQGDRSSRIGRGYGVCREEIWQVDAQAGHGSGH